MLRDFVAREEVIPLIGRILEVYRAGAQPGMRLREFIKSVGFEEFKGKVLSSEAEKA